MPWSRRRWAAAAAALVIVAAGCGSSSKSSSGGGKTYTIGLLTDQTGLAASGNKTSVQGVEAGVVLAKREGYTLKMVTADTQSTPAGALAAAQKLVVQDHVFVVIAHSSLTSLAANYLLSKNIPVVGGAIDGPEWTTDKNMFSAVGAVHVELVSPSYGKFFKLAGATNVGTLGYSISPLSVLGAKAISESAKHAGLRSDYVNTSVPFGSTNMTPIALAMKAAGVDGFFSGTDPNTTFALVSALRQINANIKVALSPTGYGADILQAGPGALSSAQNVYFYLPFEPVEMNTAATRQLQADLKTGAGVTGDPTQPEYYAYAEIGLLVDGLKAAGSNPTQASLIRGLSTIHNFDAEGLWGGRTLDINNRTNVVGGPDNCAWFTKLVGSTFQPVAGADPICGPTIPGLKVST